ncbi:hypothetical protein ACI2L1_12020 [Streptomyces sp. NPDC019531]|uniref:hypothetical protein n=1 Tax=Streptomyces sp. NPDC019531 TaxID=3365062 RepID=UPI00384E6F6C
MTTQITHADPEALATARGLAFEEWNIALLGEEYRDKFAAIYLETDDRKAIVVPSGQDPAERLHAVRQLLAHPAVTA